MDFVSTRDGTRIHARQGFRVVAHDRRGHGQGKGTDTHGDDNQTVPCAHAAPRATALVRAAALKAHAGALHGRVVTHPDALGAELPACPREGRPVA